MGWIGGVVDWVWLDWLPARAPAKGLVGFLKAPKGLGLAEVDEVI